jgi:para-aminobenzoate synthetase component 1
VRPVDEAPQATGAYDLGRWERTWLAADYARAVGQAREAIAAGEVYQVNLVQHLSAPFAGEPTGLAAALAPLRSLHSRPLAGDGWAIVSASPELFLAQQGRRIWTMPIKGTRPAGGGAALQRSAKDAAEHVMIVDLERNDLGRICEPGSVGWPELMVARPMAGVEHLVSLVEGRARQDVGWADAMRALFPGGSVTGAPKIAALDHINALEPVGRGASMGALGTVWPNGDFELALTIRTFAVAGDRIHLWVGGGVVWDSEPQAEVEESWVKARPLLDAVRSASRTKVAA